MLIRIDKEIDDTLNWYDGGAFNKEIIYKVITDMREQGQWSPLGLTVAGSYYHFQVWGLKWKRPEKSCSQCCSYRGELPARVVAFRGAQETAKLKPSRNKPHSLRASFYFSLAYYWLNPNKICRLEKSINILYQRLHPQTQRQMRKIESRWKQG